jgi:hypothetical protein
MTEETKAGLKLLAEYMGYAETNINIERFSYNTSWDALVPVFSKAIYENYVIELAALVFAALRNNNPQAAFEAVVELVKIINKENAAPHN